MPEIILSGCTPEPLMNYLKALGIFRLVAEQADQSVGLSWTGANAILSSSLTSDGIRQFFLNEYCPTPILAPWNGGSGFYGSGGEPLEDIETATSSRLTRYRETIKSLKRFAPKAKPKDESKTSLLTKCRSELPDDVVPWLDVCFVMGEEKATFFPLLGTGGNDGRLDFTNNFMQRLTEVLSLTGTDAPRESGNWLAAALFGNQLVSLGRSAIGQFNPGGIGGANGVQGEFEAESRVNPWDFVLMIEGALLFAGSVARRLGTSTSMRAVFPFCVDSVAVGYGSATSSEETTDASRSELWLPLWDHAATLPEVRQLFSEGRAQLDRQQAKNAVDFSLAVSLLGISRGINSFTRYGFLKRNGLAFLATPLGRITVQPRPMARLLSDAPLMAWIDQLRRACSDKERTPVRYQTALRAIDRAFFEFNNRSEQGDQADRRALTNVLLAIGKAERTLASGFAFCSEKHLRPLAGLSPQWLDQANDGSPEFWLAAAVAGIRGVQDTEIGPIRTFLEPVEIRGAAVNWARRSTSAVWSQSTVVNNLISVFRRRQIESFRAGLDGVPLSSPRPAPLEAVIGFLRGELDEERLESLTWSLLAINWSNVDWSCARPAAGTTQAMPFEFGVLRLLVEPLALVAGDDGWTLDNETGHLAPDPDVLNELRTRATNSVSKCLERAALRLKSQGKLVMGYRNRQLTGKRISVSSDSGPDRLLAAMLFPLSDLDLTVIANAVLYPPEAEE